MGFRDIGIRINTSYSGSGMDQAQRSVETLLQRVSRYGRSVGSVVGLGAAAGTAYLAAQGIQDTIKHTVAIGEMAKRTKLAGESWETFYENVRSAGDSLGYFRDEAIAAQNAYTKLVGATKEGGMVGILPALSLARGLGVNQMATTQAMGMITQAGGAGTTDREQKKLAINIAEAIARSGMRGREEEALSSLAMSATSLADTLGVMPNIASLLGVTVAMGAAGKKYGFPGLMGGRGASLLARMGQAMQQPSGEAAEYWMYRTLNPENKMNYYETKFLQSLGAMGTPKQMEQFFPGRTFEGTTTNIELIMQGLKSDIPDEVQRAIKARDLLGIGAPQMAMMMQVKDFGAFVSGLEKSGKDLDGIPSAGTAQAVDIFRAKGEQLKEMARERIKFYGEQGKPEVVEEIESVLKRNVIPELRTTLMKFPIDFGIAARKSSTEITKAFEDEIGERLAPLTIKIKDFASDLVSSLGSEDGITGAIGDVTEATDKFYTSLGNMEKGILALSGGWWTLGGVGVIETVRASKKVVDEEMEKFEIPKKAERILTSWDKREMTGIGFWSNVEQSLKEIEISVKPVTIQLNDSSGEKVGEGIAEFNVVKRYDGIDKTGRGTE